MAWPSARTKRGQGRNGCPVGMTLVFYGHIHIDVYVYVYYMIYGDRYVYTHNFTDLHRTDI